MLTPVFNNINEPLLTLTDEQLMTFIKCPELFYMKYVSKIPLPAAKSFNQLVHEVINAYFLKLLDNKLPNINKAKKIWDELCEKYPKVINDKKVLEGWGIINLFDRYCYNNKLLIADTLTPYEINFGPNVKIKGKLDTLRLVNNSLELFIVETGLKQPDQHLLDMSLKYTLEIYALNQIASGHKINCIRVLHLKSGKEFTSYRTDKDFRRLERTINSVSNSIRQELFYPREDYSCPQCLAKNYCGFM